MKQLLRFAATLLFLQLYFGGSNLAQQTFYDSGTIQKIEISFSQPNWDYQMDTAKIGADGYIMADWVKINGIQFDSAGVKYKGNISYDSTYVKNPVHIALDEFRNQSYQGFTDIKLGNGYADPSQIRDVLSYDILKNYMHCPRANFAQLYVNGVYTGLYSNDESINKQFCSQHFYSSQNTFIKCNPIVNPGPNTKSNLKFIPGSDSSAYFNYYEIKSDYGWNDLEVLCDSVTNHGSTISSSIDMDRVLWMLAFNNVLVNLDSYSGVFVQNYYLYKDNTGHFNPVVWDLNMSFGGFPYLGSLNNSMGSLTVTNMQQLPVSIHSTDPYWPLINAVMNQSTYRKMYIAHMRTITDEMFANNAYQSAAAQLQSIIDTAVQSDTNNFFTYSQFQTGMITNNPVGSYTVPGISNLMTARTSYLQSTTDFLFQAPVIDSATPDNTSPIPNSTVNITSYVSNTTAVYLGYRFNTSEKFTRVLMFDDGAHQDGAANDSVYGASFIMLSGQAQYYIYAENADAGIFSPQRAEHEFYTLSASVQTASPGQVVINEFLASNQNDETDEDGQHADWIELYNKDSIALDLFGLYLSDNFADPTKFAFAQNTVIEPDDYLIIWADEDSTTTSYLHCNFKLSGSGEELMLSTGNGIVLDSLTFGPQSTDESTGRCPNGNGPFITLPQTTFGAGNCTTGIDELLNGWGELVVYPNPASFSIRIATKNHSGSNIIRIINSMGQELIRKTSTANPEQIDVSSLPEGIYLITSNNSAVKKIQIVR